MNLNEDKVEHIISRSNVLNVKNVEFDYDDDTCTVSVTAKHVNRDFSFGNIEFSFIIDNEGNASDFSYDDYNDEDLARGASGLHDCVLPDDEDDPTYWDCVEKIIEEQKDAATYDEIFDFFDIPSDYSDFILKDFSDEIEEFFTNYGLKVTELDDRTDKDCCYYVSFANTEIWVTVEIDDDNRYLMSIYNASGEQIYNEDLKYWDSLESAFDDVMSVFMEYYADIINFYKLYSK